MTGIRFWTVASFALIGLFALSVLPQHASCEWTGLFSSQNSAEILDRDELDASTEDGRKQIELIARTICETKSGYSKQISRLSTINKLIEFLDGLSAGVKYDSLNACREKHQNSLELLSELIATSNSNVCSDAKINLIGKFHEKFVSTHSEDVRKRQEDANSSQKETTTMSEGFVEDSLAPHLIQLFFMNYAMQVSETCKHSLINNLEWDIGHLFKGEKDASKTEEDILMPFKDLFSGALEKFAKISTVDKHEDVVLFWELVKGSLVESGGVTSLSDKIETVVKEEYDEVTGEPVRLLVKVKDASNARLLQEKCHYKLKPVYEKLILPIVHLADLGYSSAGQQFKGELKELKENPIVRHWYGITQTCEAILPIKLYSDSSLDSNEIVMLTREEAQKLNEEEAIVRDRAPTRIEYEPSTNSMEGIDKLIYCERVQAQKMIQKIRTNENARDRIQKRAIVHILKYMREQLVLKATKFVFDRETRGESEAAAADEEQTANRVEIAEEDLSSLLGTKFANLSDEQIEKGLSGSCSASKGWQSDEVKRRKRRSPERATKFKRRTGRQRKGDLDAVKEMRTAELSYNHTKSWSQIFSEWYQVVKLFRPSRLQLLFGGAIILGILALLVFVSFFALVTAG